MLNRPQRFGLAGESLAAEILEGSGYRILTRNYRTKMGEIDIIARDGEVLVFVEVKARAGSGLYGNPKYAVNRAKQRRISKAALHYLKETGRMGCRARFDVVSIISRGEGGVRWEIVKNAFELAYG
ncbi:YraN family protein [Desulfococcus sp.]|jgi:putative endonuclease|uniref:YraN family protein n=1 Tax=Desulfococcus sp. TaxID=2025834 RepID=UPI0035939B02